MAAAERVFLARGYEATTIGDIASEADMSARSVYRYFATKDDLLVGRFVASLDGVVEALRFRPSEEPVWESLRAVLHQLAVHGDGASDRDGARRMHRAVFEAPTLFGRYLHHIHTAELSASAVFRERTSGTKSDSNELASSVAMASAAFGSFVAAQHAWCMSNEDVSLSEVFESALHGLTIEITGSSGRAVRESD